MSGYASELRQNWRPLLAAMIGMGSGMSVVGTITSTIVPTLLADTHWAASDFAKVGALAFFMAFAFPLIGRLTDVIGVRWTALVGQVTLPLVYFAYSQMDGNLSSYIAIFIVQSVFCVTTTSTVYTRLAVQFSQKARGLALAIVASGPAFSGFIIAPLLNGYVESHGWRAAYTAAAIGTALAGLACFLLIPRDAHSIKQSDAPKRRARDDYPMIFKSQAFWILFGAMALVNLPQTLLLVQLKNLLLQNGVAGNDAGFYMSLPLFGMLAGRFVTGYALDRLKPYFVSFISLALPSLALFVFATPMDAPMVIIMACFFLGFAFGAEGDIVAFLVARQFGVEIYSSVMGLLTAIMSFSTASGALLLGKTMEKSGGSFNLYLTICGVAVLMGATLLLLLARGDKAGSATSH